MARQVLERPKEILEEQVKEMTMKISPYRRTAGIVGGVAFAIAFVLSIVGGVVAPNSPGFILSLVALGLIVSILNITAREVTPILIASIALIAGASVNIFTPLDNLVAGLGTSINGMVTYFATFMVPVAIVTAVRTVWKVARPGEQM